MGELISVSCRNKKCNYHKILHDGEGMIKSYQNEELRCKIIRGEIENDQALKCLKNGGIIKSNGVYLCTVCKEFLNDPIQYCKHQITVSPYGTERYEITFPFGKPKCKTCSNELMFIKNVCSSKVKCPKCNSELKTRIFGTTDWILILYICDLKFIIYLVI